MARSSQKPRSSWKDIQQRNQRGKATTKVARQRRLKIIFRSASLMLLLVAILTGVVAIKYFGAKTAKSRPIAVAPVSLIEFESDGVLTGDWFNKTFPDLSRTDVRDMDVHQLKEQLATYGQIRDASVAVSLPSTLVVDLLEREPMLRIRLRDADGSPMTLLVARDGTLYKGELYPQDTLLRLPGVAGLRVRKTVNGYAPIQGLESVAHLLETVKEQLPAVYRHWKLVDLTDWDPEADYRPSLVKVKSSQIEEIIFSTYGIDEQVEQLGGILQHIERYQLGQPKLIDLSFGEEAIIRYQ